jgi:hypothetical protein
VHEAEDRVREARRALRSYMAGPPKRGSVSIANHIKTLAAKLGGTVSPDTLERFRKEDVEKPYQFEIIYRFLVHEGAIDDPTVVFEDHLLADPVFYALKSFFAVRANNLELCARLAGDYSLHFRSEDVADCVVVGAMRFSRNEETGAFHVHENQASKKPRRLEQWAGYYVARKDRIIIVLRGVGKILGATPKFYVLSAPHVDESDLVTEIGGTMLKLGSGTGKGVFSAKVLLRREPKAFDNCDVVRAGLIDDDVLREI